MSRFRIGAVMAVVVLVSLGLSRVGWGEDGLDVFDISCGPGCSDVLARTYPNGLLNAIPGGTFVITVAHLAPSPEDAFIRRRPVVCDPVKFRIDALRVKAGQGSVEVELGQQETLAAGQSSRVVYEIGSQSGTPLRTYELDLMGFRFRSEPASSRCNIVASGLFYADPFSTNPLPFALIPSADRSRNANRGRDDD